MQKYNIEELQDKLERCKNIPVDKISLDDVDELSNIKISRKKLKEERIVDFINNTKNPYSFKVGDKIVKIEFSENGLAAEDCILNVINRIYK